MAETDDRAPAEATTEASSGQRPMPATPPVIEVTDAEAPAAAPAPAEDAAPMESSLVGAGGLPAAARKADESTRNPADVADRDDGEEPFVADAPDPGPTLAEGTPPVITTHAQHQTARRGGFWPLVLGGVVAAGLGSAATIWAMPQLRTGPAAVDDVSGGEAAAVRAEIAAQLDDVMARATDAGAKAGTDAAQAALAAAPEGAPVDNSAALASIQDSLAALEDLQGRVAALEARPAPDAAAPEAQGGAAAADEIDSLRQQLTAQTARLEELAARPQIDDATLQQLRSLADKADEVQQRLDHTAGAAEQRLAAVEDRTGEVEQKVADAEHRTEALAALASLRSTLQTGGDRETAVQGLAAAGIETPDELAHDAPSLEELQQLFPAAARDGLAAALRDGSAASSGGFFTNFLRAQTGARSLEPRPGNDPDAILSRAGDAVQRGEIATALTELQALPPAGREAMADWLNGAEAWAAAAGAVEQIEGNLK